MRYIDPSRVVHLQRGDHGLREPREELVHASRAAGSVGAGT